MKIKISVRRAILVNGVLRRHFVSILKVSGNEYRSFQASARAVY